MLVASPFCCDYTVDMKKRRNQNRTEITWMLRIRLTQKERKLLDSYAGELDLPTSTWARSMLLRLAKNKKGKP